MSLYMYSWNPASKAAKALSVAVPLSRIKHTNSTFKGNVKKTVVNYGASELPAEVAKCKIINDPSVTNKASHKVSFFETVAANGVPAPTILYNLDSAMSLIAKGKNVVGRLLANSHSGKGIVFYDDLHAFQKAKFYTEYIPKKEEYRVHIFRGEIIDFQKKALRKTDAKGVAVDPKNIDFRVRNLANGFVFIRDNIKPSEKVFEVALAAFNCFPLDFGAVDIIWNEKRNQAYALEINTAPGLEGQTINSYTKAFRTLL